MINEKDVGWHLENSYLTLPPFFYSSVTLNPVSAPEMIVLNEALAKELGLNPVQLQTDEAIAILAGNDMPEGAAQIAQAYAGHQFGYFTMLGDGRAVLIGEQLTPEGNRFDLQLKGSGRTPYSRRGDGRAALGPMLREYIISEAMHALDIPTTRSLAIIATGDPVYRENVLEGAILTRVASSHIRVGTFEYAAKYGEKEDLQKLADYTIARHYPEAVQSANPYLTFFEQVMERQAQLIAKWQLVGFIHGVMNTDNMTISGETIDYGPCAFMDTYHLNTVFSSIDSQGRYAYGNQPQIAGWNLARFAESLLALIDDDIEQASEIMQNKLKTYPDHFYTAWLSGMRQKLGFTTEEQEDEELIKKLLYIMQTYEADYTNTLRALAEHKRPATAFFLSQDFKEWEQAWRNRLARQETSVSEVEALMKRCNPAVIPRNHLVEEALEAAIHNGDYKVMDELLEVLENPYELSEENQRFAESPNPDAGPYQTFCGT